MQDQKGEGRGGGGKGGPKRDTPPQQGSVRVAPGLELNRAHLVRFSGG